MPTYRSVKKPRTTVTIIRTPSGFLQRQVCFQPGKARDAVTTIAAYNPLATVPRMAPLAGWGSVLGRLSA